MRTKLVPFVNKLASSASQTIQIGLNYIKWNDLKYKNVTNIDYRLLIKATVPHLYFVLLVLYFLCCRSKSK